MATAHGSGQRYYAQSRPDLGPEHPVEKEGVGALISEFFEQGRALIRAELAGAKAEMKLEARRASRAGVMFGAGGVLGLLCAMALTAFLIIALSYAMPAWASALLVTCALGGGAAALLLTGKKRLAQVHGPKRTLHNLEEDAQWAKETMRAAKSELHANG